MKCPTKILTILSAFFFAITAFSEVSILGSQTKMFTTSIVSGQEYVLQISLPAGYANGKADCLLCSLCSRTQICLTPM